NYITCCLVIFFFFFSSRRRHTRCLSDWSSDVCSSDLAGARRPRGRVRLGRAIRRDERGGAGGDPPPRRHGGLDPAHGPGAEGPEIGRASCRERVEDSVGAGALREKESTRASEGKMNDT